jgi:hypothetical protein
MVLLDRECWGRDEGLIVWVVAWIQERSLLDPMEVWIQERDNFTQGV